MTLTKEVIEQLLAVKQHILAEPRRFDMGLIRNPKSEAPCGTTCCIAGWLLKLAQPNLIPAQQFSGTFWQLTTGEAAGTEKIAELFGLESEALFYEDQWPEGIRSAYWNAETPKEQADAGAKAIEAFIAADGKW